MSGGAAEKDKWERAWDFAKAGDIENIPYDIRIKNYNTIKKIHVDYGPTVDDLPHSIHKRNFWYYGKTGTGKSHAARVDFPDAYLKIADNHWWDGYQGQKNVIIDDFDKFHVKMGHRLKVWGDRYAFPAEVKGCSIRARPERICITSNYHPSEIWDNESTLGPLLRRFHVVHFMNVGDNEPLVHDAEEVRAGFVQGFVPPPVRIPSPVHMNDWSLDDLEANGVEALISLAGSQSDHYI